MKLNKENFALLASVGFLTYVSVVMGGTNPDLASAETIPPYQPPRALWAGVVDSHSTCFTGAEIVEVRVDTSVAPGGYPYDEPEVYVSSATQEKLPLYQAQDDVWYGYFVNEFASKASV